MEEEQNKDMVEEPEIEVAGAQEISLDEKEDLLKMEPKETVKLEETESKEAPEVEEETHQESPAVETWGHEKDENESSSDGKKVLITTLIIIGLFALFFGGFSWYNGLTGGSVITINDLHKDNLDGDLPAEEGYLYNGFSFIKADGLWWTNVKVMGDVIAIPLHYGPKELEGIPINGQLSDAFNDDDSVYMAINPEVYDKHYNLAFAEMVRNLAEGMNRDPVAACTKDDPICVNRTILSCENNPDGKNILEFVVESGKPRVESSGTCITIYGQEWDIVKATNRFIYRWYEVMP